MTTHALEISRGERFAFGANWMAFLSTVDDRRIETAERSVCDLLEQTDLSGQRFLDIGCGSGLFSLAARRLGATVHSIDFDPQSVACTNTLKQRYFPGDSAWTVEEGSVLDADYLGRLGEFDAVYSWGVLHHTGAMWSAIDLAAARVAPGGLFAVALYNDRDQRSVSWRRVKKAYCAGPVRRFLVCAVYMPYLAAGAVYSCLRTRHNPLRYFTAQKDRGMSVFHDWKDWLGGYPYEVASPGKVIAALRTRDFTLVSLRTTNGLGCNQFVFRRSPSR